MTSRICCDPSVNCWVIRARSPLSDPASGPSARRHDAAWSAGVTGSIATRTVGTWSLTWTPSPATTTNPDRRDSNHDTRERRSGESPAPASSSSARSCSTASRSHNSTRSDTSTRSPGSDDTSRANGVRLVRAHAEANTSALRPGSRPVSTTRGRGPSPAGWLHAATTSRMAASAPSVSGAARTRVMCGRRRSSNPLSPCSACSTASSIATPRKPGPGVTWMSRPRLSAASGATALQCGRSSSEHASMNDRRAGEPPAPAASTSLTVRGCTSTPAASNSRSRSKGDSRNLRTTRPSAVSSASGSAGRALVAERPASTRSHTASIAAISARRLCSCQSARRSLMARSPPLARRRPRRRRRGASRHRPRARAPGTCPVAPACTRTRAT